MKCGAVVALALCFAAPALAEEAWEASEHGRMLKRILPPGPDPAKLPEAGSHAANLLEQYCVQCHYLPDPKMHAPDHWPHIVDRMVRRMRGEGNIGREMKELMGEIEAPDDDDAAALVDYLKRHGQRPIDAERYAGLSSTEGRAFSQACSQCHALPDPRSHTAGEWPEIVERMQKNLAWTGVVSSTRVRSFEPQLNVEKIIDFLQRNSRVP